MSCLEMCMCISRLILYLLLTVRMNDGPCSYPVVIWRVTRAHPQKRTRPCGAVQHHVPLCPQLKKQTRVVSQITFF